MVFSSFAPHGWFCVQLNNNPDSLYLHQYPHHAGNGTFLLLAPVTEEMEHNTCSTQEQREEVITAVRFIVGDNAGGVRMEHRNTCCKEQLKSPLVTEFAALCSKRLFRQFGVIAGSDCCTYTVDLSSEHLWPNIECMELSWFWNIATGNLKSWFA